MEWNGMSRFRALIKPSQGDRHATYCVFKSNIVEDGRVRARVVSLGRRKASRAARRARTECTECTGSRQAACVTHAVYGIHNTSRALRAPTTSDLTTPQFDRSCY